MTEPQEELFEIANRLDRLSEQGTDLVMTAEDEQVDGKLRARMNVVHEAGLFQGRLGFTKAIILLEERCEEFSNIEGLGQIRFPEGNIGAAFEEIRRLAGADRHRIVETACPTVAVGRGVGDFSGAVARSKTRQGGCAARFRGRERGLKRLRLVTYWSLGRHRGQACPT